MTHDARRLRANLAKVYLYKLLGDAWIIAPILIPFYAANGLNATQVFTIQAAYALSVLAFEVPSGYLADVIGRRRTLILGAALLPAGVAVYAFTGGFWTFILAEFIIAVGNSLRSGSDSALIYDTLVGLEDEGRYKRFEGKAFFFSRLGSSLASVLGGALAAASLRLPFYVNIGAAALMLPLALSLVEPARPRIEAPRPLRDILGVVRLMSGDPRLRPLVLLAALVMGTGIVGLWAYFLYYQELGVGIGWFGLLFALAQLASASGSKLAGRLEAGLGSRRGLLILLAIGAGFLLLGAVRSLGMYPVILLNLFVWGYSFPVLLDLMNRRIESRIRATALSVAAMAGSLAFAILSPAFGRIVDSAGLRAAFFALGALFLTGGGFLLALLLKPGPDGLHDKIEGTRPT
jgi:MFS family permease